jgi:hypothetical protein
VWMAVTFSSHCHIVRLVENGINIREIPCRVSNKVPAEYELLVSLSL